MVGLVETYSYSEKNAPPSWAVAAVGESRLEPIDDAKNFHIPINLSSQVITYIGRSQSNNVTLYNVTSSRHHAMMYHHPNGSCFVQDINSVHGTYVNGKRIPPSVPVRIRRGCMLRFGNKGSPEFILKTFYTHLNKMVRDLNGIAQAFVAKPDLPSEVHALQSQAKESGVACIRGDGGMACVTDFEDARTAALVLLNTRLNATGGLESLNDNERVFALRAHHAFGGQSSQIAGGKRSRSFDNFSSHTSIKKRRLQSSPRSILAPLTGIDDSQSSGISPFVHQIGFRRRFVHFTDEEPQKDICSLSMTQSKPNDENIGIARPILIPINA